MISVTRSDDSPCAEQLIELGVSYAARRLDVPLVSTLNIIVDRNGSSARVERCSAAAARMSTPLHGGHLRGPAPTLPATFRAPASVGTAAEEARTGAGQGRARSLPARHEPCRPEG